MQSIQQPTIAGFNQFIATQRAVTGECTVTLVQFDDVSTDTVFNARPVRVVPDLTTETFVPRGNTPLYDAIAHTINATGKFLKDMPADERPAKIVCVIITDGQENASKEFDQAKVFAMIKHQQDIYKWEFVFIGANQNAMVVGRSMGINAANCYTNNANAAGTSKTYDHLGSNLRRMRAATVGSVSCCMSFSDEQRQEQDEAAGQ